MNCSFLLLLEWEMLEAHVTLRAHQYRSTKASWNFYLCSRSIYEQRRRRVGCIAFDRSQTIAAARRKLSTGEAKLRANALHHC
jgi:hypothetical protein